MQPIKTVFYSFNVRVDVLKGLKSLILNEWDIKKFDNCFIVQTEESKMKKPIGLSLKSLNKK